MDGHIPGRSPAGPTLCVGTLTRDRAHRVAQGKYVNQVSKLEVRGRMSYYHFVKLLSQRATVLFEE